MVGGYVDVDKRLWLSRSSCRRKVEVVLHVTSGVRSLIKRHSREQTVPLVRNTIRKTPSVDSSFTSPAHRALCQSFKMR